MKVSGEESVHVQQRIYTSSGCTTRKDLPWTSIASPPRLHALNLLLYMYCRRLLQNYFSFPTNRIIRTELLIFGNKLKLTLILKLNFINSEH